jgi:hypothetical protein
MTTQITTTMMVHIIDLSDSAKLQRWQSRNPMRNDPRITAIKRTLASKEKSRMALVNCHVTR